LAKDGKEESGPWKLPTNHLEAIMLQHSLEHAISLEDPLHVLHENSRAKTIVECLCELIGTQL